jgi:hypothetical protein
LHQVHYVCFGSKRSVTRFWAHPLAPQSLSKLLIELNNEQENYRHFIELNNIFAP